MKEYLCPRCDDVLDDQYPGEYCLNCGGFVKGIVPPKTDWEMSNMTAKSAIQSGIMGLILLFIILCFVLNNE